MRRYLALLLGAALLSGVPARGAEQSGEESVRYVRASVRGFNEGERVKIRGIYAATSGLREASRFYFRNKGYSRFSLRDAAADVWFGSFYCEGDSDAFQRLLGITAVKLVVVEGTRGRGEDMEPAIFVTAVRVLGDPPDVGGDAEVPEAAPPPPSTAVVTVPPGVYEVNPQPQGNTFRIKIIDSSANSTSILSNVELGKPFRTFGTTIILERE